MATNWKNRLTRWQPHREAGQVFDLTHLHPFAFSLELVASDHHDAKVIEIRVGFSNHTFTRGRKPDDGSIQFYGDRTLCHQRYPLSHSLPTIVMNLGSRNCFYANQENYFVIESADGDEYWVFFDVRNVGAPDAVLLFVQSAYPADEPKLNAPRGRARKKVGFKVLVNCALKGTRPKPSP
jgi:hypothetical protein